ncbi:benzoyl-CoA reductase/2-hydroxyglutaryl-CoA dehydratase subunit BcrC/BadD/HgdB [Ruminiclostridium sufflavum DSM 19573]|uniref:Benzoyl-CoA reductase/2-hydroxyglutaryl-CoA dehydratase subunit BcrC/BadD/HgdB n=1 Tax=Ruminiclostridium sufflavum DSM 19573 TaxID=1121337 RepID=A0A318XRQ2_9FIRM|nr:2-hydroxyacyl-CoA dehydratase [Ruminiclostridium sufflavum]PYG90349.1 benzoyl-CoA reductase/2-hydroxyglutaryl-CoA dehydratase subunit BcrC/BadD/HgdB [Ruminiclostridium sufflavum DSM 19573]
MKNIGITTTVPVEVLLAAGYNVIDINNAFISGELYALDIERAERDGFPKSSCAWIKGIYGACIRCGISEIVGVAEGDCSNTKALLEVLRRKGIKVYSFSYPAEHTLKNVTAEINKFLKTFNVSVEQAEAVRKELNEVRNYARVIDELTYIDNKATGFENHISQVSLSDFVISGDTAPSIDITGGTGPSKASEQIYGCGYEYNNMNIFKSSPAKCRDRLLGKIYEIRHRTSENTGLRIGYTGVPPMTCDIYPYVEGMGARIVYNEVQREFAFPRVLEAKSIYEQYYDYTYPYDLSFRLKEIKKQIELRRLDGILHYTQAFCHRAIEDIVIKEALNIPVLTIEGDKANRLDSRTKLRIEAFLDMLRDLKLNRGGKDK